MSSWTWPICIVCNVLQGMLFATALREGCKKMLTGWPQMGECGPD